MSLIAHHASFGDLKVYDLKKTIGFQRIRQHVKRVSNELCIDRNCPGDRHVLWVHANKQNEKHVYTVLDSGYIAESKANYKRIQASNEPIRACMTPFLDMFIQETNSKPGIDLLIQYHRIYAPPVNSFVWRNKFSQHGFNHFAIMCTDRDNTHGGVSQFTTGSNLVSVDLVPGRMLIFNDLDVLHKTSGIYRLDKTIFGYMDFVTVSSDMDPWR